MKETSPPTVPPTEPKPFRHADRLRQVIGCMLPTIGNPSDRDKFVNLLGWLNRPGFGGELPPKRIASQGTKLAVLYSSLVEACHMLHDEVLPKDREALVASIEEAMSAAPGHFAIVGEPGCGFKIQLDK